MESAKCILPILEGTESQIEYGTRHKAALSLTEDTDAMVIVVSEETGKISIAMQAELNYDLTDNEFRQMLLDGYQISAS